MELAANVAERVAADATALEQWRPIIGFDGYEVSDLGRVRSWRPSGSGKRWRETPLIMRPSCGRYLYFALRQNGKTVYKTGHSLVCEAFIGPRPPGLECAHENGVNHDNKLSNLSYKTHVENVADTARHGTQVRGSDHVKAKLSDGAVMLMRWLAFAHGMSWKDAVDWFGVSKIAASSVVAGFSWRHVPMFHPAQGPAVAEAAQ